MKPRALILTGHGINCEEETAYAFSRAGAQTKIMHVNDLVERPQALLTYQILAFPGGFSFGDETGSGKALANYLRNHIGDQIRAFAQNENLTLGICNGFQVLTQMGLLPSTDDRYSTIEVALTHNERPRYHTRWVDLLASQAPAVFTRGIEYIRLPVAHGEGKLVASPEMLQKLHDGNHVALQYSDHGMQFAYGEFPYSPNGSFDDIAALTDTTGRVFGLMPHPERAIEFTQLPDWTKQKEEYKRRGEPLPTEGPGMALFRNAVEYFE